MNRISVLQDSSDYNYSDFLNYDIDGQWLDEWLDEIVPGKMLKGLVPTSGGDMECKEEEAIVKQRILPAVHGRSVCPILMCPDDRDFSCTLVVAEIINDGNVVTWARIGFDKTQDAWHHDPGRVVTWFDVPEIKFALSEYTEALSVFGIAD